MIQNWATAMQKLQAYPPGVHRFRPPCKQSRIDATERQLGTLHGAMLEMLAHFNGARVFDPGAGGEMIKVFGISEKPPLPKFEWAPVWNIDKYTPQWRAAGANRKNDWPIA